MKKAVKFYLIERILPMKLREVLSAIPFYESNQASVKEEDITSIVMDHREVKRHSMFVCIVGFQTDGHLYAQKAVENGATVIISEKKLQMNDVLVIQVRNTTHALAMLAAKFYHYPSLDVPLVGITGTNGKTSTSYILETIFQQSHQKVGVIGTIQLKIANQTYSLNNTTPHALDLQRVFRQMIEADVEVIIMEVSSHALELGRVLGCNFDVAACTNITRDHLDFHETYDNYLQAKTKLFTGLGHTYGERKKYAVLNLDDPSYEAMIHEVHHPLLTYGLTEEADVRATKITYDMQETSFHLITPVGEVEITSPLIGKFNVYNMLAATAIALTQQIPLITIKRALEAVTSVAGRFEQVKAGQDFTVIVDYAHTPDSLQNVLETVQLFATKSVYIVVGAGGDRDKQKRPLMGEIAVSHSNEVVFTADNPRTEKVATILQQMTQSLRQTNYKIIEDRRHAIEWVIQQAETGDVVIIAGKGHETYQEVDGIRYPFDDRVIAEIAIKKRS